MTVAYVSSATFAPGAALSWICPKPSGVVAGDLMIAVFLIGQADAREIVPPSGWVPVAHDEFGDTGWIAFSKTATASEPTSYTFRCGHTVAGTIMVWAWRSTTGRPLVITDFRFATTVASSFYFPACAIHGPDGAGVAFFAATEDMATFNAIAGTTERINTGNELVSRFLATANYGPGTTLTEEKIATYASGAHRVAYGTIVVEEQPPTAVCSLGGWVLPLPSRVEIGHAPVSLRNMTASGYQSYQVVNSSYQQVVLASFQITWEGVYEEELQAIINAWVGAATLYRLFHLTGLNLPVNDAFGDFAMVMAMPDEEMNIRYLQEYRADDPTPDGLLYDVSLVLVSEPLAVV